MRVRNMRSWTLAREQSYRPQAARRRSAPDPAPVTSELCDPDDDVRLEIGQRRRDDDIADPYGRDRAAYVRAYDDIADAVDRVGEVLVGKS